MDAAAARRRMVETQIAARGVRDAGVLAAMRIVPREAFVAPELAALAYEDGPLPIDEGQTISQPYVVAQMLSAAGVARGCRVLEVGVGSGYAAAVMAAMGAHVWGIERHAALVVEAEQRLAALGYGDVALRAGDGAEGWEEAAPFNAIIVSAAGAEVPAALRAQLAVGGRLVMPVGGGAAQMLSLVVRAGVEDWQTTALGAVMFVPLVRG